MGGLRRQFDWNGIGKLPKSAGVYKIGCGKDTYYIGSTNNLKRRAAEHKRNGNDGCYINYLPTKTRKQAYDIERSLIGKKCPSRNQAKPSSCNTNFLNRLFGW